MRRSRRVPPQLDLLRRPDRLLRGLGQLRAAHAGEVLEAVADAQDVALGVAPDARRRARRGRGSTAIVSALRAARLRGAAVGGRARLQLGLGLVELRRQLAHLALELAELVEDPRDVGAGGEVQGVQHPARRARRLVLHRPLHPGGEADGHGELLALHEPLEHGRELASRRRRSPAARTASPVGRPRTDRNPSTVLPDQRERADPQDGRTDQPMAKTTLTSTARSCEPGSMAIDAAASAAAPPSPGRRPASGTVDSMIRRIVADLGAGGRRRTARRVTVAFSIAAVAGVAEHGLGVVVGERDPAERQLLADEALQRVEHLTDLVDVAHGDGDVRRRLVAGDRLAVVGERRAQAEARRLDVLLGDAEARQACRRAPATSCRSCPSPRRPCRRWPARRSRRWRCRARPPPCRAR